jgi:hypothetical protein
VIFLMIEAENAQFVFLFQDYLHDIVSSETNSVCICTRKSLQQLIFVFRSHTLIARPPAAP